MEKKNFFFSKVALGYSKSDSIHFDCAGTIISEKFILTVAHCAKKRPTVVRVGAVSIRNISLLLRLQNVFKFF